MALGGPTDGAEVRVGTQVQGFAAMIADRTRHRYMRTPRRSEPVVLRWAGRV